MLPNIIARAPSLAVVGQGVKRTVLNGVPYDYRAASTSSCRSTSRS